LILNASIIILPHTVIKIKIKNISKQVKQSSSKMAENKITIGYWAGPGKA